MKTDRAAASTFSPKRRQYFMAEARKRPELAGLFTTALFGVPQVGVKVDNAKAMTQQIQLSDLYQTVQTFMGGSLINFFNRFGLQWQVYVQADGDYRTKAENLGKFYVRNASGEHGPPEYADHYICAQRGRVRHALQPVQLRAD